MNDGSMNKDSHLDTSGAFPTPAYLKAYPTIIHHISELGQRVGVKALPIPEPGVPGKDSGVSTQQIVEKLEAAKWARTDFDDFDRPIFGDFVYRGLGGAVFFQKRGESLFIRALLVNQSDGPGNLMKFTYDDHDRLTQVSYTAATEPNAYKFTVEYAGESADSPFEIKSNTFTTNRLLQN